MEHQLMQPLAPYAEKQFGTLEYKLCSTHDQLLDTAQQLWADWWQNGVYQRPTPKRKFVGSGEDVCLNTL